MRKGNLLAGISAILLLAWLNIASASEGLILGFTVGSEITLNSATSAERAPSPRSIPGPTWTLAAIGKDGTSRWARVIAPPREFHGDPDTGITFSVIVPEAQSGDRLLMTDTQGLVRWTRIVDDVLLIDADKKAGVLRNQLSAAYAATEKLQRNTSARDRSVVRAFDEVRDAGDVTPPMAPDDRRRPFSAKNALSGTLYHVGGTVVTNNVAVRVFDATTDELIVSMPTDWSNSRFEFDLPGGRYVFEVDDNRMRIDSSFFYRKPYRTAPIQITSDIELPEIPQNTASGEFVLAAQVPCSLLRPSSPWSGIPIYSPTVAVVAADATRIVRRADRIDVTRLDPVPATGQCPVRYSLQLSPGAYSIEFSIAGWESLHFDALTIEDGGVLQRETSLALANRTLVWTGTLVDSTNTPAALAVIDAITEVDETSPVDLILNNGRFEFPYSRGWTIEFSPATFDNRESVTRTRVVVGAGAAALPSKVVLDDVAIGNTLDSGLLRIQGDGTRENHYNILFLGDGYTDIHETYTDTNGNGVWDGIVWYDMDGDGLYNGLHDRYTRYGQLSGEVPEPNPSANNEPFDDINNDGMLNVDDPAQFELNARDFMRSLLGSDFWSAHKQAFNAYLLFEPSLQAGSDVTTESGQLAVERSTRYEANLLQPRLLMMVDREAAMQRALAVLPEVDMVVVLVNQTVLTLARGNVTFAQPGSMVWPSGLSERRISDMGPAHEMGHYAATLCDEYSEFPGVSPLHGNPSTGCPNTSYLNDPKLVPWSNWIPPGSASPTLNLDGSLGIFEGAEYYAGGAYRPSFNSTMNYLSPLFNAPSRAALEAAVHTRMGTWQDTADDSDRCTRLPLRTIRRPGTICH